MSRFLIRLSPFLGILTALAFLWLLYWSWCWGWWGRNNIFLQYLFQCRCPTITEQARYPTQAQVLASACQDESSKHALLLQQLNNGFVGGYHVDKSWWIGRSRTNYLLIDSQDGSFAVARYILSNGTLDPLITEQIRNAKNIYWQQDLGVLLALSSVETPERSGNLVLTSQDDTPLSREQLRNQIALELTKNQIPYNTVGSWGTVISRNHLFLYRGGIRLVDGEQRIIDGSELGGRLFAVGWAADDRGALLEGNNSLYLYGGGFQVIVPTGPVVPQPILLLRVPSEYLPPQLREQAEEQLQQEQTTRVLGNVMVWLSVGLFLCFFAMRVLGRFRRT